MAFSNQGAMGGAAQGAAVGTQVLPGYGTAIGAGLGMLAGGLMGGGDDSQAKAMMEAARIQAQMQQKAIDEYRAAMARGEQLYQPYQTQGLQSWQTLGQLMKPGGYLYNAPDMTNFRSDPAWLNIKNQALDAIRRSGTYSGQTALDLERQAEQLADQQFQNIYARKAGEQGTLAGRLSGIANTGYGASTNLANLYGTGAGNIANAYGNIGEAMAGGTIGSAQADAMRQKGLQDMFTQGIGGIGQAYQNYDYNQTLKKLYGGSNNTYTPQKIDTTLPVAWGGGLNLG